MARRFLRWNGFVAVFAICLLASSAAPRATAAPSAEIKAKMAAAGRDVNAAEKALKAGQTKEALDALGKSQTAITEIYADGDKDAIRTIDPLKKRVEAMRLTFALDGIELPPFQVERPKETKPAKPGDKSAAGKVSFLKQVAPMLVAKCGGCHIDDSKGKFNMATFASLQKGSAAGRVIFPKDGKSSRIVELIAQGDMPRGGAKVTPDELAALTKWIDEGAMFDGQNVNAAIKALVGSAATAPKPEQPKLEVVQATGRESTSWSRDVASVVASTCITCHGDRQPRGQFSMANFEAFLRGGQTGQVIVPGKPAESLLIKKLKGQAGDRMPLRAPPLSEAVIAKIEKWITEGAKFDGPSPQMMTQQVAETYIAQHSTHEDLSKQRADRAEKNWRLAAPGEDNKPTIVSTENFLVYGKATEAELKAVADRAEKQITRVAKHFKAPVDKPLIKGRTTIFVFNQRYDYGEFGQMVEKRQIPNVWHGHWGYTVLDAYAAVLITPGEDDALDSVMAQQLASIYVAAAGPGVPRWFAEGAGRAVAASLDARDKRVKAWDNAVVSVVASGPKADAFITGGLPPEEADIAAYGFVKELRPGGGTFQKLIESLRGGTPFDRAFANVYRATPAQSATAWAMRITGRRR